MFWHNDTIQQEKVWYVLSPCAFTILYFIRKKTPGTDSYLLMLYIQAVRNPEHFILLITVCPWNLGEPLTQPTQSASAK